MLLAKFDKEINIYESYVLSTNKDKFIENLIPNSQTYNLTKYYHELNSGNPLSIETNAAIQKLLGDARVQNRISLSRDNQKVVIKYLLSQIKQTDKEDKLKEILKDVNEILWKHKFNYSKPAKIEVTDNLKDASSEITQNVIPDASAKKLQLSYNIEETLKKKNPGFILDLIKKLTPSSLCHISPQQIYSINNLHIFEKYIQLLHDFCGIDQIVEYVNKFYLQKRKVSNYFSLGQIIYKKMTIDQLLKLKSLNASIGQETNFNKILMKKKFGSKEFATLKNYPEKELAYLNKLKDWAKNTVKSELLGSLVKKCLLVNGIYRNDFNIELFFDYLQRPTENYHQFNPSFKEKLKGRILNCSEWRDYSIIPAHLVDYHHNNLLEKYVERLIFENRNNANVLERFLKYFNPYYITKHKIKLQLKNGESPAEKISDFINESEVNSLVEEKRLKILEHNQKRFLGSYSGEGDDIASKVEIEVQIKNIQKMVVKTFEINTKSYYMENKKQFEDDIDLDGLIPASQEEFDFSDKTEMQTFNHKFSFPEISKVSRGLFIIELVGGGLSSRAIIKKGALTLVRQNSVTGLVFIILNEKKKICQGEKTGLFVKNKWYKTNEKGEIIIPYSKDKKIQEQAILIHGGFADIAPFEVPRDNYCFFTSLMFNEESFQAGNTVQFIIQPKLLLNLKVVTLKKLYDIRVNLETTNRNGLKSNKIYKDLKLSYQEDLVIDFLMPQKIHTIKIKLEAKLKNLKGDEVDVKAEDTVLLNRYRNSGLFYSTFLRWTQEGYQLRVIGKNGEILKNKTIKVKLSRKFLGGAPVEFTVSTGKEGKPIFLGTLENVSTISTLISGSSQRAWTINNKSRVFHIQSQYEICKNEDLVIPCFGDDPHILRHSLLKLELGSNEYPVQDCFSSIKREGNNFVLKGLPEGEYKFIYKGDINFSIFLTIINGKRWEYSSAYINHGRELSKMLGDLNYLTIKHQSFKDGKLKLGLNGNQIENTKVHIMGYLHYPDNSEIFHRCCRRLTPTFMKEVFSLSYYENSYLSEKKLPDEIQYVIDRQNREIFMGNTLEKPPLLLKRHFMRDTTTEAELLGKGQDFGERIKGNNDKAFAQMQRGNVSNKKAISYTVEQIGEFQGSSGLVIPNVKPNKDGEVEIEIPNFKEYSHLQIFVADPMSTLSTEISLPKNEIKLVDGRLKASKQEGSIYTANRYSFVVKEGERGNIQDLKNTEYTILKSLEDLFDAQTLLAPYNNIDMNEFKKWRFLVEWETLTKHQKLVKYSEFQSHELNVFLYFKDVDFFSECVAPHLESKSSLDLIDHVLLGNVKEVKRLLGVWNLSNLNPLEISLAVLLLKSENELEGMDQAVIKNFTDACISMNSKNETEFNKRFDSIIVGKKKNEVHKNTPHSTQIYGGKGYGKGGAKRMAMPQSYTGPRHLGGATRNSNFVAARAPPAKKRKMKKMASKNTHQRRRSIIRKRSMSSCCSESDNYSDDEEASSVRSRSRRLSNNSMLSVMSVAYQPNMNLEAGVMMDNDVTMEVDKLYGGDQKKNSRFEVTKEYKERQYYYPEGKTLFSLKPFWVETIKAFVKDELDYVNFSGDFIFCCTSITEMIAVLSIMTFDLEAHEPKITSNGDSLKVTADSPVLIFCKESKEQKRTAENSLDLDVMISQTFFDPEDRYIYDQQDPSLKILKKIPTFKTGRRYASYITVTNTSEVSLDLQILTEIPQGAIPVTNLNEAETYNRVITPMSTTIIQFYFYFPKEGEFFYYPATVAKNGKFVKSAAKLTTNNGKLPVFSKRQVKQKMETMIDVLSQGQKSDILKFMENVNFFNTNIFDFSDILWLMKDKQFYQDVIALLRRRHIFNASIWRFSIYHGSKKEFYEYLAHEGSLSKVLTNFKYLKIDGEYEIKNLLLKEYNPLVNPRIHDIGNQKHNILNNEFQAFYTQFCQYCFEKGPLDPKDKLILVCYLILQDRVKESLEHFKLMDPNDYKAQGIMTVQFDYLRAYLSLYTEYPEFKTARIVSEKYIAYHLLAWRNRFVRIANQLSEYDEADFMNIEAKKGGEVSVLKDDPAGTQGFKKKKIEILKAKLIKDGIEVVSRNINQISVKYYLTDLEFLFSKDPFLNEGMKNFIYVNPNKTDFQEINEANSEVAPRDDKGEEDLRRSVFPIPDNLKTKNLLIYVSSNSIESEAKSSTTTEESNTLIKHSKKIVLTYFPITFKLQIYPEMGIIKTSDSNTKKPTPKVYIKCFSKSRSGAIKFFKDGYTDLRGIFDYASGVQSCEEILAFSILVKHENLGSMVRVVEAPEGVGQREKKQNTQWNGLSTKLAKVNKEIGVVQLRNQGLKDKQAKLLA